MGCDRHCVRSRTRRARARLTGNGTVSGHTGIVGIFGYYYPNDWGIVSNDSQTGLLLELWDWKRWQQTYVQKGGLETAFFLAE